MTVSAIRKEFKIAVKIIAVVLILIIFSSSRKITAVEKSATVKLHPVELLEYTSEELNGYDLYVVYPQDEAPLYFLKNTKSTRALWKNEDTKMQGGIALTDHEFISLQPSQEVRAKSGIITYAKFILTKKDNSTAEFHLSTKKHTIVISNNYVYANRNASAKLILEPTSDSTLNFQLHSTTGDPNHFVCEINGALSYKGNIAYFQSQEASEQNHCKLFLYFSHNRAQVIMTSYNMDCGCGMDASPEGVFTQK